MVHLKYLLQSQKCLCRRSRNTRDIGHLHFGDVCHVPQSSSGRSNGSGRGLHAPQYSASSTTSTFVISLLLNTSRMNGCVWVWSSHIPRPQKRQVPTAVLLQCQQSTSSERLQWAQARSGDAFGLRVPRLKASPISRSKPSRSSRNARTGVRAFTVAVRGTSKSSATSPK